MAGIDRYPKNTDDTLYIRSVYELSFADLIDQAKDHFGECFLEDLQISSEKIHTRCITYDLYDGSDWDDYIIIRKGNA